MFENKEHECRLSAPNRPKGWTGMSLSEFAEINPTESLSKKKVAKCVPMDCIDPFTRQISRHEANKYTSGMKFRNGDTLLARISPCLENGKTAYVDFLSGNEVGFGSTEYIVIREKTGMSDKKFLYYMAISPVFRETAIKAMTGTSGRQRVQTDLLKNKIFYFPPLPEQRAIASVLSSFDDKIELLRKQNETLEKTASTLFSEWFGKYRIGDELPEGWRVGKLGELCKIDWGNTKLTKKAYVQGSRFIAVSAAGCDGTIDYSEYRYTNFVISAIGENCGALFLPKDDFTAIKNTLVVYQKEHGSSFFPFFGLKVWSLPIRGAAQPFISKGDTENFEIVIPPRQRIEEFESFSYGLFQKVRNNHFQIQSLCKTRDILLPELLNGKISIS